MHLEAMGETARALDAYQKSVDYAVLTRHRAPILNRQLRIVAQGMSAESADLMTAGAPSPKPMATWLDRIYANDPLQAGVGEVLFRRGLFEEQRGRRIQARGYYKQAEAADQSSSWAWRARLAAARTLLEDYREHPTDDGLAHAAKRALRPLVDQSAHQGVRDAATRLWDSLQGAAADHDFSIALFYDRNSLHPEAARAAYRRFLDSHPDAPQATDAKRRLIYLMASDLPLRIRPQVDLVEEFPPTQSP